MWVLVPGAAATGAALGAAALPPRAPAALCLHDLHHDHGCLFLCRHVLWPPLLELELVLAATHRHRLAHPHHLPQIRAHPLLPRPPARPPSVLPPRPHHRRHRRAQQHGQQSYRQPQEASEHKSPNGYSACVDGMALGEAKVKVREVLEVADGLKLHRGARGTRKARPHTFSAALRPREHRVLSLRCVRTDPKYLLGTTTVTG